MVLTKNNLKQIDQIVSKRNDLLERKLSIKIE